MDISKTVKGTDDLIIVIIIFIQVQILRIIIYLNYQLSEFYLNV